MDPISNCQRAVDGAREMIATVRPDEMAKSTTCESWDVRALINHMIGVCQNFAGALQGAAPGSGSADSDLAGDDPAGAYARAADVVMREWRAPGALEKTLKMSLATCRQPSLCGSWSGISSSIPGTWPSRSDAPTPWTRTWRQRRCR